MISKKCLTHPANYVIIQTMNTEQFIKKHGGPSALARELSKLTGREYSRQAVWYWIKSKSGIPANLLLDYPRFFKGYDRKLDRR